MIKIMRYYFVLAECMEDIILVIKPTENDKNKRLGAIKEIVDLVGALRGVGAFRDAAVTVKPFVSFVSKLYAKSGDLDVSVELANDSGFPTGKKRKKNALRELGIALRTEGVARDVQFILSARVPVLKYVSNHFGISCDISIDNYPGRIKSRALYWISTIDERVGDMVLLVKEWARAQNINDPKSGTLKCSYTLCLRVLVHFQKNCKPAILPLVKETFIASIAEGSGGFNEKHFDRIWEENIAKFRRQLKENIVQRNNSSMSHLLASFFEEESAYYIGQLKQTQDLAKSSCRIVNDPFDISDGAAIITVDVPGLQRIAAAFKRAKDIIHSDGPADRNELLSLLCTPEVGSKLGGRVTASRYINPAMSPQQHRLTGSTGSGPVRRPQGYNSGRQAAAPYRLQPWRDQ